MMRAVVVVLCVVSAVVAKPPVVRTKEEIESFRQFLESTKTSDGKQFLARSMMFPDANPEEISGKFQGDIILDDFMIESMLQEYAMGRNAYIWPNSKWPNNTVVWAFAENHFGPLQQAAIKEAIAQIENNTCVKFRYREPEDTIFVMVTGIPGGCYAHIGYWEGRGIHQLNLAVNQPGSGCFRFGTIVHEWMHILGFFHMHSTYNRDKYVRIMEENIMPGQEHNFDLVGSDMSSNLNVTYDYRSCMHYSTRVFSSNGLATIIAIQQHFQGVMGQRVYITDKDWLRVNRHYNCPGAWD